MNLLNEIQNLPDLLGFFMVGVVVFIVLIPVSWIVMIIHRKFKK